jgi:hypothetical protein
LTTAVYSCTLVTVKEIREMKRQEKIEALVRVRDYIRQNVDLLPEEICKDFNILAAAVGIKYPEGWCQFGVRAVQRKEKSQ